MRISRTARGRRFERRRGVDWDLRPVADCVATHRVTANFPPELRRASQRLSIGQIPHEREDQRQPQSNKLLAYVFDCQPSRFG
ncbi:MAG: hypothetical protein ABIQ90_00545 [Polaromonas sp.]